MTNKREQKENEIRRVMMESDFIGKNELLGKNFRVIKFGLPYGARHGWVKNVLLQLENGTYTKICIGFDSALDKDNLEGIECSLNQLHAEQSNFDYFVFEPPIRVKQNGEI
jgi:hypothetical protein